ncbi:hypothetical protein P4S55_25105 [Shewanella sp. PP-Sp27a-2]
MYDFAHTSRGALFGAARLTFEIAIHALLGGKLNMDVSVCHCDWRRMGRACFATVNGTGEVIIIRSCPCLPSSC